MFAKHDAAAVARRLVASTGRPLVGTPVAMYVVQLRCPDVGWPDWIDVAEAFARSRAQLWLAELADGAAALLPPVPVELQIVERQVLA